jgi:hypothetical protein
MKLYDYVFINIIPPIKIYFVVFFSGWKNFNDIQR